MPDASAAQRPRGRFGRFLAAGAVGFIVDAGLSTALVSLGAGPLLARVPAFLVATIATYTLNRRFAFRGTQTPPLRGWLAYVGATGFGAALNYGVYALLVAASPRTLGSVPVAIAAGSVAAIGFNYFVSSRLVFRSRG